MKRRIISAFLCVLILLLHFDFCSAGDGVQHEADLEKALLGYTLETSSKDPQNSTNLKAITFGYLEDAIYLCIDQMGSHGQEWLDELNHSCKVEGLPESINEFTVPPAEHEKYTHLGWDYTRYSKPKEWAIRQNILLATVSKVFNFPIDKSKEGNERYTKECTNMSKLIYYIHILGDHSRNKYGTNNDRIQMNESHTSYDEIEEGLINELRRCIAELFYDQRVSNNYCRLMVKLNVIRFRSWINGDVDSEQKYEKVHGYANGILEELNLRLPKILENTVFFARVFK